MPGVKQEVILTEKGIGRAITRISHELLERNSGADTLVLIGIIKRGADIARRIASKIKEVEGVEVPVGLLDINLYCDDVHSKLDQPIIQRTEILFGVIDRNVILVDDVLYTGRTIRAALDAIIDFGRPRSIQLAVLIDRGHRELPIRPDYVGKNIPTSKDDRVVVKVRERDKADEVVVKKATRVKKARVTGSPESEGRNQR